jgi:hypothetical protein
MGDRIAPLLAAAVVAVLGLAGASRAGAAPTAFRSPDGNAACVLAGARLTCSNRVTQLRVPPIALSLGMRGDPGVVKQKLTWDGRTPVLQAGAPRKLGHFTCRLLEGGLLCSNPAGGGIAVAKDRIAVLSAPAVSP